MDALQGRLLVASGALFDPNFRQTVVLVAEHGDDGALGIVLNRPGDVAVADAAPPLAHLVPAGEPLFVGGPVQPRAALVLGEFEHPDLAPKIVAGTIGLVSEEADAARPTGLIRARVYAGYAGWGPGQLEDEIAQGAWILEDVRVEDVFCDPPGDLWPAVLRRKGGRYAMLALMPVDPSLN